NCATAILCSVCDAVTTAAKEHDFAESWTSDSDYHWHACENAGCTVVDGKSGHESSGSATETDDEYCTTCDYVINSALGFTVTYVDGVVESVVFEDQVYSGIASGTTTPVFVGTPSRLGYIFEGWSPEVAGTVTKTQTYTAVWTVIKTIESIEVACSGYVYGANVLDAVPQVITEGVTISKYTWKNNMGDTLEGGTFEAEIGYRLEIYFDVAYDYTAEGLAQANVIILGKQATYYSNPTTGGDVTLGDIKVTHYPDALAVPVTYVESITVACAGYTYGANIADAVPTTTTEGVTISLYKWKDGSGNVLTDGTFAVNIIYRLELYFLAKDGYTLADVEQANVLILGEQATHFTNPTTGGDATLGDIKVMHYLPKLEYRLQNVVVTCAGYAYGEEVTNAIPVSATEGVTVATYKWYKPGRFEFTSGTFKADTTYELWMDFEVAEGYLIEDLNWSRFNILGTTIYDYRSYGEDGGDIHVKMYAPTLTKTFNLVSFNGNGAEGAMEPVRVNLDKNYVLPDNGFTTPENKLFRGWIVNEEIKAAGSIITVTDDITINAAWYEYITEINITELKAPVDCQTPSEAGVVQKSDKYTVGSNKWLTSGSGGLSGTFHTGTTYLAYFSLTSEDGYLFAESLEISGVNVNAGELYNVDAYNSTLFIKVKFVAVELLKYTDSDSYDVPRGLKSTAITPIDVSGTVSGGTLPYTFSIIHNYGAEDWLTISEEGILTGTRPATAQSSTTITIGVTDAMGQTNSIYIAVGAVEAEHVDANSKWESDGTYHWHTCACGVIFDKDTHSGGTATCKTQKECEVCSAHYGVTDASNHEGEVEWADRTANEHASAYNCCGVEVVPYESHAWENGVCSECEYACSHVGGTATCKSGAICDVCGKAYTAVDADNHEGTAEWTKTATTHGKVYSCCDEVAVVTEEHHWENGVCSECEYVCSHSGGTATCITKAKCETCGKEYGSYDANNHEDEVVWYITATTHEKRYDDCCEQEVIAKESHNLEGGICSVCEFNTANIINSVVINELKAPLYNQEIENFYFLLQENIYTTLTINGEVINKDTDLFGNIYLWDFALFDENRDVIEDTNHIITSGTYYLGLALGSVQGYPFADDVTVTVNGATSVVTDLDYDLIVYAKYEVSPEVIEEVTVNGVEPQLGLTLDEYYESTLDMTING
ncbi:MAG: InlB B-repeat-containing protein, partial [Clostridia bacterium]|nr:InlB B-repeat-containing protein [Clostridia bacterium]